MLAECERCGRFQGGRVQSPHNVQQEILDVLDTSRSVRTRRHTSESTSQHAEMRVQDPTDTAFRELLKVTGQKWRGLSVCLFRPNRRRLWQPL